MKKMAINFYISSFLYAEGMTQKRKKGFWRSSVLFYFFLLKNQSLRISDEETRVQFARKAAAARQARTNTFYRVSHQRWQQRGSRFRFSKNPRFTQIRFAWHAHAVHTCKSVSCDFILYLCFSSQPSILKLMPMVNYAGV